MSQHRFVALTSPKIRTSSCATLTNFSIHKNPWMDDLPHRYTLNSVTLTPLPFHREEFMQRPATSSTTATTTSTKTSKVRPDLLVAFLLFFLPPLSPSNTFIVEVVRLWMKSLPSPSIPNVPFMILGEACAVLLHFVSSCKS